jgi:hypothetical protein
MPEAETGRAPASALRLDSSASLPRKNQKLKRDWEQDMGSGATVGAGNYPAKFSFASTNANCASAPQPDFVVYGTGLFGSTGQANIVAYDNLYSGCGGTVPTVYWAYNTGAPVLSSPVFSRDGTQVAYVQSNGSAQGILVLLKWAASTTDTIISPTTLTRVVRSAYPSCMAPCMTTWSLVNSGGMPDNNTNSSVFYDYTNDTAYVGDDSGWLHKFTPVFNGSPTEVTTGGWPVQVNPVNPTILTSPVHDFASGNVFVADKGGFLYRVDSTTAAVTTSGQLDFSSKLDGGPGIVQGPIVDSTGGLVYVFAPSDGSAFCNAGAACAGVYQLTTSFIAGDFGSEAEVGNSTVEPAPPNPLYIGAFDSAYENSVDPPTGNLYVCGNTGGLPTLYQVPITAGAFAGPAGISITQLTTPSATPPCSPVTDVYNPNAIAGPTEWIFVSVQDNGLNSGCGGGGCLFNFEDLAWQPSTTYAVGQEILALSPDDSRVFIQAVIQAGTSGVAPPRWTDSEGAIIANDGTVQWINQGPPTGAALAVWQANQVFVRTDPRIVDSNGNVEVVTTAGTTGAVTPAWSTVPGGTTTDGTVTWTNAGMLGSFVLPSAGGTSGIIVDNTVSSGTEPGASQVYFSTLSDQICGTSVTPGGCAVQASQSALQ